MPCCGESRCKVGKGVEKAKEKEGRVWERVNRSLGSGLGLDVEERKWGSGEYPHVESMRRRSGWDEDDDLPISEIGQRNLEVWNIFLYIFISFC